MRQLGGIGKAAMSGAIDGFKKRRAEAEKERKRKTGTTGTKVTGSTDTSTGSTGASSFFGGLLKSGIKKVAGIKDDDNKVKTKGGKEITGDTSPKSQTPDSASKTKSGKDGETGANKQNMSDRDKKLNKANKLLSRKRC